MAKRFTDSDKWKDRWFRSLPPQFKLGWLYLLDNCDQAGVIELDEELANFQIGQSIDWRSFIEACEDRVQELGGGKYFVVKFVSFQYGSKLSQACKAHNPVFQSLEKHSLPIPFPKGMERDHRKSPGKGQGKGNSQSQGKGQGNSQGQSHAAKPTEVPEGVWQDWLKVRASKRACPPTQTVMNGIEREAAAAGITVADAIRIAAENSWQTFKAEYYDCKSRSSKPKTFAQQRVANTGSVIEDFANGQ